MSAPEHIYYAYIMASLSRTLYVGFTSGIEHRVWQHKHDAFEGFSKSYRCHRLVWYERFQSVDFAIAREKQVKRWSRAKKIELIERVNPAWVDLSAEWGKPMKLWSESGGNGD